MHLKIIFWCHKIKIVRITRSDSIKNDKSILQNIDISKPRHISMPSKSLKSSNNSEKVFGAAVFEQ